MINYKALLLSTCLVSMNSLADVREDLSAQLAAQDCLAANFEQRLLDVDGQELQHSSGSVRAAKPNSLRWAINAPDVQLIVSDGETLWRYEEDLEQLIVSPFDDEGAGLPSRLLSGDTQALDAYTVEKIGDAYTLIPTQASDLFQQLSLRFNVEGLAQVSMTDSFEQITEIQLTATDADCNDPSLYQFEAPAGIDVIYE